MRFMVSIQVETPPDRAQEARSLVPAEREHIAEHQRQGIMEAIYTDVERPPMQIWAVMQTHSLEEVQRLVEGYPLHEFFDTANTELSER